MRSSTVALVASLAVLWTGGPAGASRSPRGAEGDGLGLPLPGPGLITSPFGWRLHPILHRPEFHEGVDFGASAGTPVRASEGGTVELAGWRGNYGRYVRLRHAGGLETGYAHLARVRPGLHVGARVRKGEVIGAVGASGLATGPHLFYEVFDHGRRVDPRSAGLPVGDDRSRETLASVRRALERRPDRGRPRTVVALAVTREAAGPARDPSRPAPAAGFVTREGGATVRYRLVPVDPQGRIHQLAALALARPALLRASAPRPPRRRR